MADHKRERVLTALQQQLIAAGTAAAGRWFRSRTIPVTEDQLPCGLVRMPPGQSTETLVRSDVNAFHDRTLTAMVVLKVATVPADAQNSDLEATINAFSLQVENAIQADPTLGGVAMDMDVFAFFTDMQGDNADFGDGVLMVRIKYRTLRTDASQP